MTTSHTHHYYGKTALITGGSSGIGLALAKKLAAAGANVFILARRPELLKKACQEIQQSCKEPSQKIDFISADIVNFEKLSKKLTDFFAENSSPDILINSAGVAHPGRFDSLDLEVFHWLMNVNYFGTVNVTKIVVPEMIRREKGLIINISSIAGFLGVYGYTAYSGSKYAVRGFSDVLRAELKPHNIQVSIVFPPDTQTPQLDYENQFKPDITKELASTAGLMSPDDVACQTLKKAAKGKYIITPGFEATIMFQLSNLFAGLVYPIMDKLIIDAQRKIEHQNHLK